MIVGKTPFHWVLSTETTIFTHVKFHVAEIEESFGFSKATRLITIAFKEH